MRALAFPALCACLTAGPAFAGTACIFNVECYMSEPCAETAWELTVDRDAGTLSSVAEVLEILHVDDSGTQIAAKGADSLNLLTIGAEISVFTTHIGAGPAAITYVGECHSE